ncbi:MAG: hypothetical protein KAR33_12015 [Candidatus Thorarchaeota archaeon]|nr:hypothetical protein [Candidatus Thorarchaeota archaeon]
MSERKSHTSKNWKEMQISLKKSLLSGKKLSSGSRESAAVHHAQLSLSDFGDKIKLDDNDPAVVRTVETLSVAGIDGPAQTQEKEARSIGGIPSR